MSSKQIYLKYKNIYNLLKGGSAIKNSDIFNILSTLNSKNESLTNQIKSIQKSEDELEAIIVKTKSYIETLKKDFSNKESKNLIFNNQTLKDNQQKVLELEKNLSIKEEEIKELNTKITENETYIYEQLNKLNLAIDSSITELGNHVEKMNKRKLMFELFTNSETPIMPITPETSETEDKITPLDI